MMRRLKRLLDRSDDGFTMVEVLVAMTLLGTVLGALFQALNSTQINVERQMARSQTNDEAHLAAQAMDRELRSGDLLYNPSQENYGPADIVSGYSMRLYSEANIPTRGEKRCVQYRITSSGELQRRDWEPEWNDASDPKQVTGWRILATGLQNRAQNVAAFSLPQINLADITLLVNSRPGSGPISGLSNTVRVEMSISGRNSAIVSNLQQCGPDQPDPSLMTADGRRVPPYS